MSVAWTLFSLAASNMARSHGKTDTGACCLLSQPERKTLSNNMDLLTNTCHSIHGLLTRTDSPFGKILPRTVQFLLRTGTGLSRLQAPSLILLQSVATPSLHRQRLQFLGSMKVCPLRTSYVTPRLDLY